MRIKSVQSSNVLPWGEVVGRKGGASSDVVKLFKITWSVAKSPRVTEQCDVNIHSLTRIDSQSIFYSESLFHERHQGSLVANVTDSWLVCHEFDPNTDEDPPC
ncbi:hypothetical protein TNCV_4972661 [Trichonephila clavipes]|nr:hypothetical protein TNCV_4972661 [Trichonephila clavipes]